MTVNFWMHFNIIAPYMVMDWIMHKQVRASMISKNFSFPKIKAEF